MSIDSGPVLSVESLLAEREARRQRDREAEEQFQRRHKEELAEFKQRLDNFQLTEGVVRLALARVRSAFERGESEWMITSFPVAFCSDDGRAVINADLPPINKPSKEEFAAREDEPEWVSNMPAGVRQVFDYWKTNLKPGGFGFGARIIDYHDGKPGNVGLFLSWKTDDLQR
jgi:hypothetical protein